MPANSRPDAFDVALVALSARPLARSARRAGLRALTLDLFADADTREHAAKAMRVPPRAGGFDAQALMAALETHAPAGLPVVFGSGFEDAIELMAEIGRRHPIRGAAPETVTQLKDPFAFAGLLQGLGIVHPEVSKAEADDTGWLSKRIGGSGGAHIRRSGDPTGRRRYAQRQVEGAPFSALFLADGRRAFVIGFSEQWTDPTAAAPYRYGGAAGPISPPPERQGAVAAALDRIVAATGLRGLASTDMLAPPSGPKFILLEINPRPGATLDLFDCGDAPPLLAAHLAACDGALPTVWPRAKAVRAAAVVYAPRTCSLARVERPAWTADWPAGGEKIPRGAPVCTILATAQTATRARVLVESRRAAMLDAITSFRRTAASYPLETMAST